MESEKITLEDVYSNPNKFLTNKELCELLNLKEGTLQEMRKRRKIVYYKINSTLRYKSSDIVDFLESIKVTKDTPKFICNANNSSEAKKEKICRKPKELPTWDFLKENPDYLMNTYEVKQVLGVSDPTLYRWRQEKVVRCVKVGGVFKYFAGDIMKYLEDNKQ